MLGCCEGCNIGQSLGYKEEQGKTFIAVQVVDHTSQMFRECVVISHLFMWHFKESLVSIQGSDMWDQEKILHFEWRHQSKEVSVLHREHSMHEDKPWRTMEGKTGGSQIVDSLNDRLEKHSSACLSWALLSLKVSSFFSSPCSAGVMSAALSYPRKTPFHFSPQ